jgi:hypothetical protein
MVKADAESFGGIGEDMRCPETQLYPLISIFLLFMLMLIT